MSGVNKGKAYIENFFKFIFKVLLISMVAHFKMLPCILSAAGQPQQGTVT